ncbi:cell division ATP-binding protein FtsE [Bifidobacterium sp. MA2]|uniref:Cell division ATP-binding protein FtsE n=1 Tax=Bifidobacterium santillanense TaxID=2809028 RepID=A0ABS5UNC2_9BIFI|nr:cell division ATP-binding protein FtsE [Bifidobacterium santillanense]MBT1172404.1 cell division ATP-binding protein FtsE [Bifidobacterium santillanense]
MALISLKHVSKVYPKGTRPALDDINLDIDRGDFVFLVGASGSGKTTLLSLLLREEEATDGEIRVAGNDLRRISNRQVPQYRRTIGFVFQDYKLLNNKTVWQNVAFALEVIGTRRSAIKSLVPKVLETVGLTGKEDSYPHELSGGEQQRVAIARAYVNHPQILLADEPTGNLDPTTSLGIMEVLDAINRTGTTIVMATHNEEIVNSMRKRVVELHAGRIVRDEEHGSYDSAAFFPDAEVTSKAHQAIGAAADAASSGASSAASDMRFRPQGAVETEVTRAIAIEAGAVASGAMNGDEGIARLAQSVHSGRTGRYGEAFAPLETTLTWGKGLKLDEMERIAKAKKEAEETASRTAVPQADAAPDASEVEETAAMDAVDEPPSDVPAPPVPPTGTAAPAHDDGSDDGRDADDRTPDAGLLAPPAPPAPPVHAPARHDGTDDVSDAGDGNADEDKDSEEDQQ